jgi:hypothetical protein
MKQEILDIINNLEEMSGNWGFGKLVISCYLYITNDIITIENMSDEKINKINEMLENFHENLFNEKFNKLVENIKE